MGNHAPFNVFFMLFQETLIIDKMFLYGKGDVAMGDGNSLQKGLEERIAGLALSMEKMKLAEYVSLLEHPWQLMYINFIAGLARGVGIAVGFTILGAVLLYFLRMLVVLNLPWIGGIIAEIVQMVQMKIGT